MRSLRLPPDQSILLKNNIKTAIRSPTIAYETLMNNDTVTHSLTYSLTHSLTHSLTQVVFIENYSKFVVEKSGLDKKIPPFLVTLATYYLKKTPAGKWVDLFTKSKK